MNRAWITDTAERVFFTFLAAFGAALISSTTGLTHQATWKSAAIAGLAAALTTFKSTVATCRSSSLSPASLAGPVQPQQAQHGTPPDAGHYLVELAVALVILAVFVWVVWVVVT